MVSSDILLKLKTSYTLKCLLTTNFQLMTFLNTSGTKKTVSTIYRVGHKKRNQILKKKKKIQHFLMICWKSKNCINDLQQADELSKLNYNGLAERYSLQRDTDKCQFIWNDVRSFEMLTFTYNLIKTLLVSGLPFKTYAPQDRFFDLPSPCRHMYAFRVPPFFRIWFHHFIYLILSFWLC